MTAKPRVVCLCGSTRFSEAFQQANLSETLAGRIVLSIGCDTKSDDALYLTAPMKERLDELHKRKIDLADEVLILNVGGYIGDSTASEIEYALTLRRTLRWLEPAQIPASYYALETRAARLTIDGEKPWEYAIHYYSGFTKKITIWDIGASDPARAMRSLPLLQEPCCEYLDLTTFQSRFCQVQQNI